MTLGEKKFKINNLNIPANKERGWDVGIWKINMFWNEWFHKISIPLPQRVIGNSDGEGVLKAKTFKGKYEPKLEFSEGWAFKPERPSVGEYGYFLEQHNLKKQCETNLV